MCTIALSVVIPSRDRRELLERTLRALDHETCAGGFEVIVVNDGSQDDTARFLTGASFKRYRLMSLDLPARGPAAARNRGIEHASAGRILLLGDDTIPAPGLLAAHLALGQEVGVQGTIEWDPELDVTPVMRYLAPAGPQFYFVGCRHAAPVSFAQVLGSNMSAPTSWFWEQPFDERFTAACVEDTELAYRWHKRGRRVVYSADAVCWHHHRYDDIAPFLERQRRAGSAARLACRLHPRLVMPLLVRPTLYAAIVGLRWLRDGRRERLWDLRSRAAFAKGFVYGR
jgi:glycosyltransferase involved in cell wall biosynthesis